MNDTLKNIQKATPNVTPMEFTILMYVSFNILYMHVYLPVWFNVIG